jgi:ligand-binding SRPBCC domain-containing protein
MNVFKQLTDPALVESQLKGKVAVKWQNPGIDMRVESEFSYLMERFGVEQQLRFKVDRLVLGNSITYSQVEGPFRSWSHTLKFEDHGPDGTLVTDLIDYEMPFGLLGRLLDDLWWRQDLLQILKRRVTAIVD